jgi:hypothetical protein
MILTVKSNPKNYAKEVFIDELKVGIFEQMNSNSNLYSFMSTCPNERLTGDHYIIIGKHLNMYNA